MKISPWEEGGRQASALLGGRVGQQRAHAHIKRLTKKELQKYYVCLSFKAGCCLCCFAPYFLRKDKYIKSLKHPRKSISALQREKAQADYHTHCICK